MTKPPLTVQQFLRGGVTPLPENFIGPRDKPRASSIAGCARANAYMMAGSKHEPFEGRDLDADGYTQEQGRLAEDMAVRSFERNGLAVVRRQISLPEGFPLTGHPDGEWIVDDPGYVAPAPHGWESKHLGRWGYEHLFQARVNTTSDVDAIRLSEPGFLVQSVCYGVALGWTDVTYVVTAQDASSTRSDARMNANAKTTKLGYWARDPRWNPKAQLLTVDLEQPIKDLWPAIWNRTLWLVESGVSKTTPPASVAREYDPDATDRYGDPAFPCGWCPWYNRCRRDGSGGQTAPRLPLQPPAPEEV